MTNTSLPPLPLIDNCLFIDNSGWMEGLNTCTRLLQYKSLNLRIQDAEKASLNFGSALHLALEHRYRHYGNSPVDPIYYEQITEIFTNFFSIHPVPMDDWRSLNWAMSVLKKYNERYSVEEFNLLLDKDSKPIVELPFTLPLYTTASGITVIYTGRIDLPISIDNKIFVMDHKTTSMMGQQFFDEMRMTSQQRGYVWAFESLTGQKVSGYIINGIRTKEVPAYVLSGKSRAGYGGKTLSAESWWQETFQREKFLIKPGELDEWKNNTIELCEEFFWHYSRGLMPMKTKWCAIYGKCQYYEVCRLAVEDRMTMLNSGMFTANTWSPLNDRTKPNQTTPTQPKQ